jgi:hypothetical protein
MRGKPVSYRLYLRMNKIIFCLFWAMATTTIVHAQLPAYDLPKPAGWGSETFPLPPAFAPEITYQGTEDIRFSPGWAKSGSNQYWSYAFVWLVEGKQSLTVQSLSTCLAAYYKGIYTVNLKDKPAPRPGFTTVQFQEIKTAAPDQETYEGRVSTLNYLNHEALLLNVRVHLRNLAGAKATAIFFEVSPQPYTHAVWKDLREVIKGFKRLPKQ